MKTKKNGIGMILMALMLSLCAGCSGNDRNPATSVSNTSESVTQTTQEGSTVRKSGGNGELNAGGTSGENDASYQCRVVKFDVTESVLGNGYAYRAIVEIENTGNTNICPEDTAFHIEDADGNPVQSDTYPESTPDVIKPGEKGYLFNQYANELEGVTDVEGLQLRPEFTVTVPDSLPEEYEVSDVSITDGAFGVTATGMITNHTEDNKSLFHIDVIYYDENGDILAISGANVDMGPGETVEFQSNGLDVPVEVKASMIADYEVIARDHYFNW
ncbi:MAG: hypothetical protein IJR00_06210 [Lachnospiraceae bacterium]|nr:hypothetical protein [Lachnospiraceae bacterium]